MVNQQDSTYKLRLGSSLANRFQLNYDASLHLMEYRFGFKRSLESLDDYLGRACLMELYQHNFPREYAASQADDRYAFDRHSERELEFFGLLPKLFPFPEEIDPEEMLYGIPIMPLGHDHWNLSPEDYSTASLVVASLLGHQENEQWDISNAIDIRAVSPKRLDNLCQTYAPNHPLRGLCVLTLSLDFQSGNPFLDTFPESPSEEWDWTQEAIETLIKAGQEIEFVQQCDRALSEWLEADPQHLSALIALWNQADYASEPMLLETGPRKPKITTITAQEWVAGITRPEKAQDWCYDIGSNSLAVLPCLQD